MELQTYGSVLKYLEQNKRKKHLLLGNGFSMAYDKDIFSYNALHNLIMKCDNQTIKKIFKILNTQNFEIVMQQLDNFAEIAAVLDKNNSLISEIKNASQDLKKRLIDAIKILHPEHVFKIPEEKSISCTKFLNEYLNHNGFVFTTNYDLLLYWVLVRNNIKNSIDGFGRDRENDENVFEEAEYSELRWGKHKEQQTIHYLHGALPLFDDGIDIIKEEYDQYNYLLEKVKKRIDKKHYPIFVTAGDGKQKLNHIMHNAYLSFCYEKLTKVEGSLVTFGFNFGDFDDHIIKAINKAAKNGQKTGDKLLSIYIGIYSEDDYKHISSIANKFKCKVNLYDVKSVNIWDSKAS